MAAVVVDPTSNELQSSIHFIIAAASVGTLFYIIEGKAYLLKIDYEGTRAMTIFQDLSKEYERSTKELNNYWLNTSLYARSFANGLRIHLGAPEHFDDQGVRRRYVEVCMVDENDETGQPTFKPAASHPIGLIQVNEDGSFRFGVTVILEIGPNTFPKSAFGFSIGISPRDGNCKLRVAGRTFDIDMSNDHNRIPIYDHMVEHLKAWLAKKPWELDRQEDKKYGFVRF